MTSSYETVPKGLPAPIDDGATTHLLGLELPDMALASTRGGGVDLKSVSARSVVYCYPMTGQPGVALPTGWDDIPGARGCTPQSCAYRDHHVELSDLGVNVFGLSTQATSYQREMAERLHLPFPVLSDQNLQFAHALNLPTFEIEGSVLIKRLTMIINSGLIEAVHYPVFPSDSDPAWVLNHLKQATQTG